jgi:hypothetical protein
MDNSNPTIQLGATSSGANQGVPPPPPGFVPDVQSSAASSTLPPPPSGFVPETSQPTMGDDTTPLDNFMTGAGHGLASTANGALGIVEKLGNPSGDLNNERAWFKNARNYLSANETNTGTGAAGIEQGLGSGVEDIAEFLLGDEALKGLSVSDRLLKAAKLAKTVEDSPALNRIVQLGLRAVRGSTIGAAQSGLKTGDATDAALSGIGAGLGNAVLPELPDFLLKDIPGAVTHVSEALKGAEKVVQPDLQGSLRSILNDVAADHKITIPSGTAMRDYAENLGTQIKGRASSIYKTIDNAIGTRFQTFDEQLSNVRRALRDDTGIDHDYTGKLIEREGQLTDAKAAAEAQAISNGVDPDTIKNANAYWRQGSALQDLSSKIRQSTSGLPDSLNNGSQAASTAHGEVVSPNRLAPAIHRLRDSGRLAQAVSDTRADDLLRAVESAKARTANISSKSKLVGDVGKVAAKSAIGAGAGTLAWETLKHTLGF